MQTYLPKKITVRKLRMKFTIFISLNIYPILLSIFDNFGYIIFMVFLKKEKIKLNKRRRFFQLKINFEIRYWVDYVRNAKKLEGHQLSFRDEVSTKIVLSLSKMSARNSTWSPGIWEKFEVIT